MVDCPDKFTATTWLEFDAQFTNSLSAQRSTDGIPLSYVIRKEPCLDSKAMTDAEQYEYNAPLQGRLFVADAKRVHSQLLAIVYHASNTIQWVSNLTRGGDGRKLMIALREHYDGPAEISCKCDQALQGLKDSTWNNEYIYPWGWCRKSRNIIMIL